MSLNRNISYLIISLLVIIIFQPQKIYSQEEDKKSEYQKTFDEFQESINKEFQDFKNQNDSIFYEFLRQSWKEFELLKETRTSLPKPVAQPVINKRQSSPKEITPIRRKTMMEDTAKQLKLSLVPTIYERRDYVGGTSTFDFYGVEVEILKPKRNTQKLELVSKNTIATFFKENSADELILEIVKGLQLTAIESNLNGWGYIELLRKASNELYPDINTQVLFTWLALNKSGYDVRVGYNNDNVFLLASFNVPLFNTSYFELNDINYYLILAQEQKTELQSIKSYEANYPAELSSLDLYFHGLPKLKNKFASRELDYDGAKLSVSYNENLTDYFMTFPECNLPVYFQPELSLEALTSLDAFIEKRVVGKSDIEKLNFLLDFVQRAMPYKTDDEQFNRENYLFAEESLCYPYSDCEDRSIFLNQLVKKYVGNGTIAIVFPGHVSLGVRIDEEVNGTFVKYKNENYYIADPTYIGAKIGKLMSEFEDVKPEIIEL